MHSARLLMAELFYVGVDVGTASVRAALVTREGQLRSTAEEPISIWEPQPEHYVQSSTDIWQKCCSVVKRVTHGVQKSQVRGLGFDATCSLVVLDESFQPVPVTEDGDTERNVVMWMDHRAAEQAAHITNTGHRVLERVGGVMSPEMQPPKLLWLKENLKESCWDKARHFFDLPDFLSWKATGSLTRSLCTLVCKWTYCPPEGWDASFWTSIGLEDLLENNFSKIGSVTCSPGIALGDGLTQEAAADLGLNPGTAVGASLIDAHAGGLGVIGADVKGFHLPCEQLPVTSRMAMICGTSSCHMAVIGLSLSQTLDDLALLYLATVQALALGTLHILEAMKEAGHDIRTLFLCGGLSKNTLFVQIHANATGLPVVLPDQMEAVLVGAAVLGACASRDCSTIQEAMEKMAKVGRVVQPDHDLQSFYERKYKVFLQLFSHQRDYQALMNQR
ncbi:FGGY carbohydrate kinase domain-containing protein isoform X3 [Leuresthes tenuis]|uniref:FGGY carbohydrate kinase domain-containing protein isoform X3 n=1 Tax=Leuresthes tenuis TaxID=355514 RepID=UPI003B513B87